MNASVECHPTAVVHDGAALGVGVKIGPYAVIKPTAKIGDGSEIGPFAVIHDYTTLGPGTKVFAHAAIGGEPQDMKFGGEVSYIDAGEANVFREFVTVNRGTDGGGGVTRIGSHNLFMAYTHIAHDCQIGDHTIFANGATLAGHVEVGDWAIASAFSAIQQFCRVGESAFLAAYAGVTKDVVPFSRVHGNHAHVHGLNTVGLRRRGLNGEVIRQLKRAFRLLFREHLNTTQALEAIASEGLDAPEVRRVVAFIGSSERGIVK